MTVQKWHREAYDIVISNYPRGRSASASCERFEKGATAPSARELFGTEMAPTMLPTLAPLATADPAGRAGRRRRQARSCSPAAGGCRSRAATTAAGDSRASPSDAEDDKNRAYHDLGQVRDERRRLRAGGRARGQMTRKPSTDPEEREREREQLSLLSRPALVPAPAQSAFAPPQPAIAAAPAGVGAAAGAGGRGAADLLGVGDPARRAADAGEPLRRRSRRGGDLRPQALGAGAPLFLSQGRRGAARLRDVLARGVAAQVHARRGDGGPLPRAADDVRGARQVPDVGRRDRADRRRRAGAGVRAAEGEASAPRGSSTAPASGRCPFCRAGWGSSPRRRGAVVRDIIRVAHRRFPVPILISRRRRCRARGRRWRSRRRCGASRPSRTSTSSSSRAAAARWRISGRSTKSRWRAPSSAGGCR